MAGSKLIVVAVIVAAAIGYLAFVGGANSWQYYLSVDEAVDNSAQLIGTRIRVSGQIVRGSLVIGDDRRQATFALRGEQHVMDVTCRCSLPDNVAEDIDVVVEGIIKSDGIFGHKVITRCASKYQSVENRSQGAKSPKSPT